MTDIGPVPTGTVRDLIGTMLRASFALDRGRTLDWYEVQVGPRAEPDDPAWERPLWRFRSDMPRFASIDGMPVHDGVELKSARPTVRLKVDGPVVAFRWELRQDGAVVEKDRSRQGISADGRSIRFTPGGRLRRSGEPARPRPDALYPPFDSHLPGVPRTPESRIRYTAATHAGHVNEDAFAVDFNFGVGTQNLGHWVLAAADGRIHRFVEGNGQVHILHDRLGTPRPIEAIYAHMDPVLDEAKVVGARVEALQRIGRIGAAFHDPGATISPHLHHAHRIDGQPVKMRLLLGNRMKEIPVSRPSAQGLVQWEKKVPGWDRPRGRATARLIVRVRRASDRSWSDPNRITFVVAPRGAEVAPPTPEPADDGPSGTGIAVRYAGADLPAGTYSVRYRIKDDAGVSDWSFDHSVRVRPEFA